MTSYYLEKAKYIFTKLKIKEPLRTAIHNMHFIGEKEFYKMFNTRTNYQKGGEYDEEIYITYKNNKFLFSRFNDGDYMYYALHENENLNNSTCIMIIIEKEIHNCSIQTLSYDDKCFEKQITKYNNKYTGSDLLKLALKLIDKIKDRYKLKTITLQDNAQKYCGKNKKINLGMMLTLITGNTWYGKYGFLPKEKDKRSLYDTNKKIVETTRMKDVPILKVMIEKALNKYYKNNKKIINSVMETYNEYLKHDKRIKSFLSYLLEYYEITCEMFYDFYEELYSKMNLTNFYNKSFIKKI
jgi:hypothetical protein